jgi:hypothetical protein
MARKVEAAPKPLDRRLYSLAQCLAAEGQLPADHPAWQLTERDERRHVAEVAPEDELAGVLNARMSNDFGRGPTEAERRGKGGAACHCSACDLDFTSVGPFDEHRTGATHHLDPALDTRRCRTPDELRERGLEPNEAGQWRRPRPLDTLPTGSGESA